MSKLLTAIFVVLFAISTAAVAQTRDPPGTPSGPSGPGQKGQPGPEGKSGPLWEVPPQLPPGFVLAAQKPGGNPESPSDDNQGAGNDPPGGAGGAPPGQTTNPNPAK